MTENLDFDFAAVDGAVEGCEPNAHVYSSAFRKRATDKPNDPWKLLAAVFSFHLRWRNASEPFGPLAQFEGGGRTAIPADLSREDIDTLREVVAVSKNVEVRSRVADVLWVVTNDYRFAEIAITAYMEAGRAIEHATKWVGSMNRYERAARLALSLGRKSPLSAAVAQQMIERVRVYKGEDPLYFTSRAIELIMLLRAGDADELSAFALTAGERARSAGDGFRARAYYDVRRKLLRSAKDELGARACSRAIAETWGEDASRKESAGDHLVAHAYVENAVQEYRKAGFKAEAEALRPRMRAMGQQARESLKAISTEIDLRPYILATEAQFAECKTVEDALCILAVVLMPQDPDKFRASVLEDEKQFLFPMLAVSSISDEGYTVAKTPGMTDGPQREAAIEARMFLAAVHHYSILAVGIIRTAWTIVTTKFSPQDQDITDFVSTSGFVPPGRDAFFTLGLMAGLRGDLITGLHVLVPQIEHALRRILQDLGIITTSLDTAGIEAEWGLGRLLSSPELEKALQRSELFSLRSMLIEQAGPNLRNRIAHGMLAPEGCESAVGLFVWWQVLHMVFLSTPQMHSFLTRRRAQKSTSQKPSNNAPT